MAKLSTPRIRAILSDPAFPGDDEGAEYTVQARNVDLCAWDRDHGRFGWPNGEDAPFLWLTYLAWKGLQRTGQVPACSLADFETRCLSVESLNADEVDPTQRAATPE